MTPIQTSYKHHMSNSNRMREGFKNRIRNRLIELKLKINLVES